MDICVITDVHGKKSCLKKLLDSINIKQFDLLLCCGDITSFGGEREAKEVIQLVPNMPFYTVFGNCDKSEVRDYIASEGISLHEKEIKIGDYSLGGFGGSNKSPFGTPLEYEEDQIMAGLSKLSFEKMILVTHVPPYATKLDRIGNNKPIGSISVKNIIEKRQPLVAISGHVHESRAIDLIGKTHLLNPGPLKDGYYGVVKINQEKIKVELKEID
ncbi:MAG: phosphodiesterase [Candidatus Methanofastidiosum methylothiophilum]|uniref:Phosphodiesterase n=1 Tax=Candidatus Methanofastidiosum methylothiophilum TaxID=1705564 RepID=A0A150J1R8_9EURY|nr:MAG: phosphodiesterase [Candidatus Methanofastidiosum methylthiophilus]KYC48636.1 MAG: phosphodiesterase [Candidatus Methanofastidiosum methylthiophilus]KYC51159.1 MAG: phosphodiesterase [Candidatus Methanofastidiosum methylthiophilus]